MKRKANTRNLGSIIGMLEDWQNREANANALDNIVGGRYDVEHAKQLLMRVLDELEAEQES